MNILNASQLKQFSLLGLIIGLAILLATQLFSFFPGLLGAVTLYILMRQWFFRLTIVYNWKKWLTAALFILGSLVVFVLPFIFVAVTLFPKFLELLNNPNQFSSGIDTISQRIQNVIPGFSFGEAQFRALIQRVGASVPSFIGATATVIANLILCFFLLYFMLVDGRKMERRILDFLPLKDENVDNIWQATRTMVVSNA